PYSTEHLPSAQLWPARRRAQDRLLRLQMPWGGGRGEEDRELQGRRRHGRPRPPFLPRLLRPGLRRLRPPRSDGGERRAGEGRDPEPEPAWLRGDRRGQGGAGGELPRRRLLRRHRCLRRPRRQLLPQQPCHRLRHAGGTLRRP
ncbi:hypothetical protein E2562_006823, partial [Oryza meyeriana var. granulata]